MADGATYEEAIANVQIVEQEWIDTANLSGTPHTRTQRQGCLRLNTTHICSRKIIEDVRKYAAEQAISEEEALQRGMEEKSKEFVEAGAEVYATA